MTGPVAGLRRLSEAVLRDVGADEIVAALVQAARDLLSVDQVHVIEVSQDAAVGHAHVAAFEEAGEREEAYVQVIDDRPSGTGRVVATGEILHVPDARKTGVLRADYVERFDCASALFVPLAWLGEVRWVMVLLTHEPRTFTDAEIELARLVANEAAAGLALREARDSQAARTDRDAALARAARALTGSLDLQTVLESLAREAAQAMNGDMGGVYLGDGVRGGVASAGWNTPQDWIGYLMKPGEGVGGQVLLTGRPAISNAYQTDVRLPANPGLRRVQTAVGVPMAWGGELKGALSVGFERMRRITRSDLQTLEAMADLATVACRNAEAFQRIESAVRLDSLTGLLDHGALQGRLREEIARAGRARQPLACLIVDLDDFERVNEAAGHTAGDELLARVAEVMRRSVRPYDVLARYGGDEFAVILPSCDKGEAAERAELVRSELGEQLSGAAAGGPLEASVGVAVWRADESAEALLDRALAAARQARRSGGAQVVVG